MDLFDYIFEPYKKRKQYYLYLILATILIVFLIFVYGYLGINSLFKETNLLFSEDLGLAKVATDKTFNKKILNDLSYLSRFSDSVDRAHSKYRFFNKYLSWTDTTDKLKEVSLLLNKIKFGEFKKIKNLAEKIYKNDDEIQDKTEVIEFNYSLNTDQINRLVAMQNNVLQLIQKNIIMAKNIQSSSLIQVFANIDNRLTPSRYINMENNAQVKLKRLQIAHKEKLEEERAYREKRHETTRRESSGETQEKVDSVPGLLKYLYKETKNTVVGEDITKADALSNDIQVRIFGEYARPGEPYNFTVIVQNESNKVARDVVVYVRLPKTIKSTKLEPISVLPPGESKRWDLRGAASPRVDGDYTMSAKVIWSGGLYNTHQDTLKVRK